jgi:Transposase IS66 family
MSNSRSPQHVDVPSADALTKLVGELLVVIAAQKTEVGELLAVIAGQKTEIGALKDEIAILKGQKPRPNIRPSRMEDGTDDDRKPGDKRTSKGEKKPRNGGDRSLRTSDLSIDEEKVLKPDGVPAGSRFKGCKRYVVQDLVIMPHVVRFHRERYVTPNGETVIAPLPAGIIGHYGPGLVCYVLNQHYEQKVPEPKILAFLHVVGIKISAAQLNALLTEGKDKEPFHSEKDTILKVGLEVSQSFTVDDTGARHKGDNWVTTHIGNDLFAWFETTDSKSRRNFLELILHGGVLGWRVNEAAVEWWQETGLAQTAISALTVADAKVFDDRETWNRHLDALGITGPGARVLATEGALWGAIVEQGLLDGKAIISDGAPQFAIGLHGRCWIHAERQIQRVNCGTEEQRLLVERTRDRVWTLYRALKAYKRSPDPAAKKRLRARFDRVFNRTTGFTPLDAVLDRLFAIKAELLLVLNRPDVPLHTNGSEGAIRCRVEERKISGCTRGDQGKRCNDTFASISKTLRKHGISFLHYLRDRFGIPDRKVAPIAEVIRAAAATIADATAPPAPS